MAIDPKPERGLASEQQHAIHVPWYMAGWLQATQTHARSASTRQTRTNMHCTRPVRGHARVGELELLPVGGNAA